MTIRDAAVAGVIGCGAGQGRPGCVREAISGPDSVSIPPGKSRQRRAAAEIPRERAKAAIAADVGCSAIRAAGFSPFPRVGSPVGIRDTPMPDPCGRRKAVLDPLLHNAAEPIPRVRADGWLVAE